MRKDNQNGNEHLLREGEHILSIHLLKASYMKYFSCIGSTCEDTCCKGWTINVDQNRYNFYENEIKALIHMELFN
ncbi:hypothetical protein [Bacillus sp. FDAARGOS_1420]|uniref:hypothetical protein n=1 Tax=Bacillus sp. FDAARGOS_1420 TaxID=2856338 RepID=UPI001C5AB5B2|nr:hypothetical protein [Bacillus sp. FDAARGOS_1420]